jgi:hypothetical protein
MRRRVVGLLLFGFILGCGSTVERRDPTPQAPAVQQQSLVDGCVPEGGDCTDSSQCCGYDLGCYCWYDPSHGSCFREPCIAGSVQR